MSTTTRLTILLALSASLAACASDDTTQTADGENAAAVCEQATEHLASCLPEEAVETPTTCDAAAAEDLLAQSCEEISLQAEGKADGFCNPWLWWTCLGDSDGGTSSARTYDIAASINTCYEPTCYGVTGGNQCARVTLHDPADEVVATSYASNYSNAGWQDLELEDGEYTLKLWRTDGTLAETIGGTLGNAMGVPAIQTIALTDGEIDRRPRFYITQEESELVRGCSDLDGTVTSTCNGAPMEKDDVEWGWLVRLEGTNAAGDLTIIKRPFFYFDAQTHVFRLPQVMPGEYTMTWLEMDVPSSSRRNNPDYDRLVRLWATGRELTSQITVEHDQIPGDIELGAFELDHTDCD